MTADVVVRRGRLVVGGVLQPCDVGISDGSIVDIAPPGRIVAEAVIDADGGIVLPGAIDIHVHFRDPGFTNKEDFAHGSAAAVCGGVTTVCDMPNTIPPTVDPDSMAAKRQRIDGSSYADFGLWAGGPLTSSFADLQRAGAVGLKIYMTPGAPGTEQLFIGDDAVLLDVLRETGRLEWPVSVHVGNATLYQKTRESLISAGKRDPAAYLALQRSIGPVEGLSRVLMFAQEAGLTTIHIAHLSLYSRESLEIVRRHRRNGLRVTLEIDPPALTFDDMQRIGARALPFVLSTDDYTAWWRDVHDGTVDILATDHSPHTWEEREKGLLDVWNAPAGFPAVETAYPIAIDAMLRGIISLGRLIEVTAIRPAQIVRLAKKGDIERGKDADFVIVDPESTWTVDQSRLHSKAGWSPFHGRILRGRIRETYLRGKLVARDGDLVSSPFGRFVSPSAD